MANIFMVQFILLKIRADRPDYNQDVLFGPILDPICL